MRKNRYCLELQTYADFSPGAYHYYATVRSHDKDGKLLVHTLTTKLSEKEAARTNRADGNFSSGYKPGDVTERFPTKEEAITAAIEFFKKASKPGDFLEKGLFASGSPQEVLDGPATLKKKANAIYKQWVECDGYEGDPDRAEELDKKWEKLFKEFEKNAD